MRRTLALAFAALLSMPALAFALPLPGDDTQTVTIKRDTFGVPHVYADSAYGLFWGNGYAQAQDRLFQMEVLRHVGRGDSAAILGPAQLDMDIATRRELYTDAERTARWEVLPAADREMFQGFADGVDAWIRETRLDPSKLSAEFYAIHHPPEDWVAQDTIAIAEFLLDVFGAGSGGNEIENARTLTQLQGALGSEGAAWDAFRDLYWLHDASTYTSIDPADGTYAPTEAPLDLEDVPAWQKELAQVAAAAEPFGGAKTIDRALSDAFAGLKLGSNALVVSPALSESGNAALIGGPQMGYYNPMVPYEVGLHGAGFDAVGMGVGGAPGVIIGRTARYAWTVTSGSSDQVDVVAFKLADADSYYLLGESGKTADLECRTEIHYGYPGAVDQSPPVLATQEVCRTVRGPVVAINEDAGYVFVRERTHRLDELRSGILWLTLSRSPDLEAFQARMESFRFEFNFLVATDEGDIAYFHFGANPDRSSACDPRLPRLAGACDWEAVRTGSLLPYVVNPSTGYIVNWNNKPAQGWSGGDSMEKWGPVHRVELLDGAVRSRLAADGKLSTADLRAINEEISTRSPFPANFVPAILAASADHPDATIQAARAALSDWAADGYAWTADDATCDVAKGVDPCFGTHSPGFTIYENWRGRMQEAVFGDEMGPTMRVMGFVPETSSDPHAADHGREDNKDNTLYNAFAGTTARAWCDSKDSPQLETCAMQAMGQLQGAVDELTATYGPDVDDWRQPMRTIKFVALSGGPAWRIPMVNRPSFNHWYDFGTGEAGSNLPPGTDQQWDPVAFLRYQLDGAMPDAHKRDQLDMYVDFEYKPAQMTPPGGWESVATFDV